ncbi:hypothetical protein [Xanthomonas theicola]|uniref:hypothetical protein n=1 Tax=Xanthomonas theicola TaxID=56464 RepID=UPI001476216F|nr:hypothetical protein [Xanthomonas theicola]QNH23497.1 hypothetical protein G4Q83_15620 [Xanthomonas theicola]
MLSADDRLPFVPQRVLIAGKTALARRIGARRCLVEDGLSGSRPDKVRRRWTTMASRAGVSAVCR